MAFMNFKLKPKLHAIWHVVCPYPLKSDKDSILDIEQVKQVINQINPEDERFRYITFSQFNEPLLDNRIF